MSTLAFIDTETTGLEAHHMAYEVCLWLEGDLS